MEWINCNDRMPDSMEPVLVTGLTANGKPKVWADLRWNAELGCWECLGNAEDGVWGMVENEITHRMAYPDPAEG